MMEIVWTSSLPLSPSSHVNVCMYINTCLEVGEAGLDLLRRQRVLRVRLRPVIGGSIRP